ncbi:Myelin-oligodendrocyte glycoprotein [Labeo rohita]|uniref:Myelin-oligodendrocyte glycoprotein n=1 Tax=Labeo rohita TaxID=84645 RepID=A0ABQ8MVC9_LABRO|nr:Myelin-oligodendrocyte glycoprotein [Labeo rohita]
MTELILKTVNGEGVTGDMRIVVFSSEFIFTLCLMILMKAMKSCRTGAARSQNQESQNAAAAASDETPANGSNQNQNTAESHEMNPLLNKQNQENSRSNTTEENQPDSVMHRINCVLMSVLLMITDGLIVKGPSGPLVAPLGSSVVLPCSVDELLSVEGLEVEWRRTDSDTLVHLFQDGETQTGAHDYQDRAHFFTEEIQRGNFSLRLDDLRAEDEGQYTCTVHSQQESGETVVKIKVDDVERLRVSGSSRSISASVGEDVTLNCSVDSHITPEHMEVSFLSFTHNGVDSLYFCIWICTAALLSDLL